MNFVAWIKVEHSGNEALHHEEGCEGEGTTVILHGQPAWACPGCGAEAIHEPA